MSLKVTILYNSYTEAMIKVTSEGGGSGTLQLSELCFRPNSNEVFLEAFPEGMHKPFGAILKCAQWAGKVGGNMEVHRNGVLTFMCQSECNGILDLTGQFTTHADNEEQSGDLEFTAEGDIILWMSLKKANYRSLASDARDEDEC